MKLLPFDGSRWKGRKRPGRLVTPLEPSADRVVPPLRPFTPLPPRRAEENVVPFKRRQPVRRTRRHPLVRWLKPLSLALLIVGSPVALVIWLLTSSHFAFDELQVHSGNKVSERWVGAALEPYRGQNLLRLPLGALQRRLTEGHPWVESVDLRKDLPRRLQLHIVERQASAILRLDGALYYLDRDGAVIAPLEPAYLSHGDGVDLVLVSLSSAATPEASSVTPLDEVRYGSKQTRAAVALLDEIAASDPPWRPGLSEVRVLGDEDFEVFSTDLPFSLLVRAGTVDHKGRRFESLQQDIVERFGAPRAVDLRFERRIIVQPYDRSSRPSQRSTGERRS